MEEYITNLKYPHYYQNKQGFGGGIKYIVFKNKQLGILVNDFERGIDTFSEYEGFAINAVKNGIWVISTKKPKNKIPFIKEPKWKSFYKNN